MESREKFILNYFGLEDETRLGESTQELSCHIVPVSQLEFVFMKISGMNNAGTGFFDRLDQMIIERDHQGDEMGAPRKHAGNDVVDFNGIFGVFNSGTNDVLW